MTHMMQFDPDDLAGAVRGSHDAFERLPAGLRVALNAALLAGANQSINQTNVTKGADVSRPTMLNPKSPWKPLMEAIKDVGGTGLLGLFHEAVSHAVATMEDVKTRDQTIAELRQEKAELEAAKDELVERLQTCVEHLGDKRTAVTIAPVTDLDERRRNNVKAVEDESEEDA